MRDLINDALKEAIKNQDKTRMATLRLISAAIKDRDIEGRAKGRDSVSDEDILGILAKMIRQREESASIYEENGRLEMAAQEREEIEIIRSFLPQQLSDEDVEAACRKAVEAVGAEGLRDMGKCMGALKKRYAGQMDFSKASQMVKELLG